MKNNTNAVPIIIPIIFCLILGTLTVSPLWGVQALQKELPVKAEHKGTVIATMNSGGYTYIQFEEGGKKMWAACKETVIKIGDIVEFARTQPMQNFTSKKLNKTFDEILFVASVRVNGGSSAMQLPEGHTDISGKLPTQKKTAVDVGTIEKLKDGYTVADCYAGKKTLSGKTVTLRGKVVKFSAGIMGKNWVHLKDGTGDQDSNDLTVTTQDTAQLGDLVVISGKIIYDKDFGAGYKYAVIVEDASVTIEKK